MKEAGWAMSGEGSAVMEGRELRGAALVVVDCPCCPSFGPCCHSFVLVRRSLVLRRGGLASLFWEGTGTALAVNCPWAVNGGRVQLVGKVAIEDEVLTMY